MHIHCNASHMTQKCPHDVFLKYFKSVHYLKNLSSYSFLGGKNVKEKGHLSFLGGSYQ